MGLSKHKQSALVVMLMTVCHLTGAAAGQSDQPAAAVSGLARSLSIEVNSTSIAEDAGGIVATVTRTCPAMVFDLTVGVTSSDPTEVRVPAYVTIPALEDSCEFTIDVVNDGDIVVLKHQDRVENGQMAAVWLVDEASTTLKRLYREGKRIRLQPANPTMAPIIVPADQVQVQGKVVLVIRQLQ